MPKKISKEFKLLGLIFAFLILLSPGFLKSERLPVGNLIGFIYGEDGKTPLEGAVVKLQNVNTDAVYESTRSDVSGLFQVKGVESGSYMFIIVTAEGEFSSAEPIELKIKENETAEIVISLIPYEERVASAIRGIPEEKEIKGEVLVGRVIKFFPETLTANVFIFKEKIQYRDKVHFKGLEEEEFTGLEEVPPEEEVPPGEEITDFYQEAHDLKIAGVSVKKVPAGQVVTIMLNEQVEVGDLVYVVRRKRLLPLFIIPVGIASIILSPATPGESE